MTESHEIVITRVFDAPRKLVFAAWTEPERMKCWWSPNGFTLRHAVGSAPAADREACRGGWSESLVRLAGYLAEAER